MLYGRSAEQAELGAILDAAAAARGGGLVLRGPVGVGRSALLDWAGQRAEQRGFGVLRVQGVQGEAGLAYGGLSQLLLPLRDRIDSLLPPQAAVLHSVLGAGSAPEHDGFLYGLATLGLLTSASEQRPLLLLLDDAHWLDVGSLDALMFAVRRLSADAVGMLLVLDPDFPTLPGLREMRLPELSAAASEQLLAPYRLERPARLRVLSEAEGNPLALHELAAAGGRFGDVSGPLPITDLIAAVFRARVAGLDEGARLALLIAAAEGHGDLGIVLAAGRSLGVGPTEFAAAERIGVLRTTGERVLFEHPLLRNACYRAEPLATRSSVHRALADASSEPGCRAYHLWSAATGPNPETADELRRAGDLARRRRAYADAATQYEWSAKLTPEPDGRGLRLLSAASMALRAGQVEQAGALAAHSDPLLHAPRDRYRLARILATVEADRNRPDRAAVLLLGATGTPADGDGRQRAGGAGSDESGSGEPVPGESGSDESGIRAEALSDVLAETSWYAWEAGSAELVRRARDRAVALGQPNDTTQALAALVDGDGERGLSLLGSVLRKAVEDLGQLTGSGVRTWWAIGPLDAGVLLGAAPDTNRLATALLSHSREHGLIRLLPSALIAQARSELWLGRPAEARAAVSEAATIIDDTCLWRRVDGVHEVRAQLAALSGDPDELAAAIAQLPARSRDTADAAANLLDTGHRRYAEVVRRVSRWLSDPGGMPPVPSAAGIASIADGVEAAIHAERPELVEAWLAVLHDWTRANALPWAQGVLARTRALVSDQEGDYLAAIDQHASGDRPFERARAELLYGRWLRRGRRRSHARGPLRSALDTFERLGATVWIDQSRAELRATGETLVADRDTAENPVDRLTPREWQVVRLAAQDGSSEQIAAQLFLSRRTVEHHLYRAYRKLGVGSRRELGRLRL